MFSSAPSAEEIDFVLEWTGLEWTGVDECMHPWDIDAEQVLMRTSVSYQM